MNFRMIGNILGKIMMVEATLLLMPADSGPVVWRAGSVALGFSPADAGPGGVRPAAGPDEGPESDLLRQGGLFDRGAGLGGDVGIRRPAVSDNRVDPALDRRAV